ncbi:14-alpha sterol demethylase Cyp51B protein [Mycena sanguinolenta]|uniref:14-alpha sterol demethylase Cyp51B protein n=1 Tax=Mycena sanguinolenta TaxID=230812 RepID=A0A8H7DFA8_9AGAR|nr:14-alpha sterol demethylase Cyp51B protein [Mycena sanguinolenta]
MSRAVKLASKFVLYTSAAGAVGFGGFLFVTRKSRFVPFEFTSDPIFSSGHFKKFNPNGNAPALHDLCVRKVPLSQIKPELLKEEGKLAEAFCAGVWSGFGYNIQRRYLERKYRRQETENQLWDTRALAESTYDVGTQITDHFEVFERTPTSISVRCGDSPLNSGVRASDGVFEMSAVVKEGEGVAEFGLKSVFFSGEGKSEGTMPAHIQYAHRLYTKLWMESALRRVLK